MEARVGTVLALLGAGDTGLDAGLVLLMRHENSPVAIGPA
jgi:hypothetical protein